MGKLILIIGLVMVASLFILGGCSAVWVLGTYNGEARLRIRYEAQTKVVETTLDNMRKTLMNQYKVSKEFADTFIKCVAMQAEGRKGGSLFKSVTEASGNTPQAFTPELANKMMNSIEGKMAEFKRSQDVWVDVWREHKTYCSMYPRSFLVGGRVFPAPNVISSGETKEAMATGVMSDDILK